MKTNFLYPVKGNDKLEISKMKVKLNDKYVYHHVDNDIIWKMVNCVNIKSLVIIGSLKYGKDFYWCNTIPFSMIYKKFPMLKAESDKFNKKGFHKKVLEAIFKTMKIKEMLHAIDENGFKKYIKTEYGKEL